MSKEEPGYKDKDIMGYFWNGEAMQMIVDVVPPEQPHIPSHESIRKAMDKSTD